jgi:hypothetical protein
MKKIYCLCLVVALTASCLLIDKASATYAKPSVPEFTINENTVTIKNQPFTPYNDTSVNKTINLYYQIRTKYHNSDVWEKVERFWAKESTSLVQKMPYPQQDNSAQYTILKFVSSEGRDDFQVRALIGYVNASGGHALDFWNEYTTFSFNGEYGDWSSTLTIGVTEPSPIVPTPRVTVQPTETSQFLSLQWETATVIGLVVAVAGGLA